MRIKPITYCAVIALVTLAMELLNIALPAFNSPSHAIMRGSWAWPGSRFMIKSNSPETSLEGLKEVFCTVGFPATDDSGEQLFITAGHCGQVGDKIYSVRDGQPVEAVGKIIYSALTNPKAVGNIDVAVVAMDQGKSIIGINHHIEYDGYTAAPTGSIVCLVDDLSGVSCGSLITGDHTQRISIRRHDVIVNYLVQDAFICSTQGDSGGPIYGPHGAVGIATADSPPGQNCATYPLLQIISRDRKLPAQLSSGVRTLFTPLVEALNTASLNIKGLRLL